MAEFQDVMRQFDRMCKTNAGCSNCPLHEEDGVSDRCSIGAFVNNSERIEREVMSWAAEHPEPVYPTWGEWLCEQGVVVISPSPRYEEDFERLHYLTPVVRDPIPADLAEKLGLEPKECV